MGRRFSFLLVLLMGLVFNNISVSGVKAAGLETLVMPGKVIEGHKKYEHECKNCHELLKERTQDELCLDCHKKVAKDLEASNGFHGKSKKVRKKKCRNCHTEHKGRDADVVMLNKELFLHDITDYPLKGVHTGVRCEGCHLPGKKYREAGSRCFDCHGEKDPHKGKLGKECEKCHKEENWKKITFDHGKTKFPLVEKHVKVPCLRCHPGERYKNITRDCFSCHVLQNIHGDRYSNKCSSCHTPKDWKKQYYDHNKTKFPLRGKHEKVACHLCHKEKSYKEKLKTICVGCHNDDDIHRGRYREKCEECHTPVGWEKASFDHSKSKFKLEGKHKKVACHLCHRGPVTGRGEDVECLTCHQQDDVHEARAGKDCKECHNEKGWVEDVVFDHDLTKFPLLGLHISTPCEGCHGDGKFTSLGASCESCHRNDDVHKMKLGLLCGMCHTPNGWMIWEFDHSKRTKFNLDGAHEALQCTACHKTPTEKNLKVSKDCQGCHFVDDVHAGRFGNRCEWCHTTKNFKEIKSVIEQVFPGGDEGNSNKNEKGH